MGHVKSQRVAFQDLSQRVGSGVLKSGRETVSIQHLFGRGKLLLGPFFNYNNDKMLPIIDHINNPLLTSIKIPVLLLLKI